MLRLLNLSPGWKLFPVGTRRRCAYRGRISLDFVRLETLRQLSLLTALVRYPIPLIAALDLSLLGVCA